MRFELNDNSILLVSDQDRTDGKRKLAWKPESPPKKAKNPAYFIPELAHVVALCDERIPFVTLAQEVFKT